MRPAAILLALCATPAFASAQCLQNEFDQIYANDIATNDYFGRSVSVCGDRAAVTAIWADGAQVDSGAVYTFRFDGLDWVQDDKLFPAQGLAGDGFAVSCAIAGDVVAVGATNRTVGSTPSAGAVYIFRFDGQQWIETEVTASSPTTGSLFGDSVALEGNLLVVGAPLTSNNHSGAVHVFRFDGSTWQEEAVLTPSDPVEDGHFGVSVDAVEDRLVVGSTGASGGIIVTGGAYTYRFDGSTWGDERKIIPSDVQYNILFGIDVSLSGDWLAAGASLDSTLGSFTGATYVYRLQGTDWTDETKLTAPDPTNYSGFGNQVSIDNDRLAVGSASANGLADRCGAVYVFRHDGSMWYSEFKATTSDGQTSDSLGTGIDLDGDCLWAGAYLDGDRGQYAGAAYVFPGFTEDLRLLASDTTIKEGERVDFEVRYGNPSTGPDTGRVVVAVVAIDGMRIMPALKICSGTFDGSHTFRCSFTAPTGSAGQSYTIEAWGDPLCGKVTTSKTIDLVVKN